MEEVQDEESQSQIAIRRPFQPKFIKELNSWQTEKHKKNRKKLKEQQNIPPRKIEKLEMIGLSPALKTGKRLPETIRNGNRILGNWINGQIHGDAEVYYSNGVIFRGVYQNGIKVKGHFQFLHGYQYVGYCLGNKFNGEGTLIFPSGKMISGQWKEYNLVEKGKIEYPNGEVYYGDIRNLKKHGKGYLFFCDGSKYVGEFEDGQITGFGTYYEDDQPVSEGNWIEGELEETINLQEIQSNGNISSSNIGRNKSSLRHIDRNSSDKLKEKTDEKNNRVQKKLRFAESIMDKSPGHQELPL